MPVATKQINEIHVLDWREEPTEILASPYYSESWLSREGAALKRRRIENQGLPNFTNWRFITFTYEGRDLHPAEVHRIMSDRIRVWLRAVREVIGEKLWCWKLELHEDGYPHYHMLLDYRKKVDEAGLKFFSDAWGLGRVNVKRVAARDINYVFKYAAKSLELVPDWVMDAPKKIRFFQTCAGFFTNPRKRSEPKQAEKKSSLLHVTHRRRIADDARKSLIKTTTARGTRYRVVKLDVNFYEWRLRVALESIALRKVALSGAGILLCPWSASDLTHENRKHRGLSRIPNYFAPDWRAVS